MVIFRMPKVIIILFGIVIAVYYFAKRSQREKSKAMQQAVPMSDHGTEKRQVTVEEVARSQHAAQVSGMQLPITGAADEDMKKAQAIMAESASKGENPKHIGGKIAAALPSFQWEDFDIWLKRFREAGEWPPLWEDVAEYYYAQEVAPVEELLASLKKDVLLQLAGKKGITLNKSAKKDDMLSALSSLLTDTDRQEVLSLLYPDGEKALHRAKSELLGHTETARSVEKVKLADWQKWGTKLVEIGTTPDSCSWCAKYAGKKMKIETLIKKQIPPIHPGCRCSIRPS